MFGGFLCATGAFGFMLVLEIVHCVDDVSLLLGQRCGRWKAVVIGS